MKNKSASQSILIGLFVALTLAISTPPAQAAVSDTTWTGAADNWNWFTDGNWSNGVPDSWKQVFVNNRGKPKIAPSPTATPAAAYSLTLGQYCGDSGSLQVDGTNAVLNVYVDCNDFDLGRVYVGKQGRGTLTITNGAQVYCGVAYLAALSCDVTPSNGSVTVDGTNSLLQIQFSGCTPQLFVGGNESGPGGTGLLTVTNGGTVSAGDLVHVYSSGTLTGNGLVATANGTIIEGTLAPSWTLTIYNDLIFQGTASTAPLMQCNVIPANSGNDAHVTGSATLTGRLSVTMTGTFSSGTDRYTLLYAEGGLGNTQFSSQSITYDTSQGFTPSITYDAYHVYLDLTWGQ